MFSAVLDKIVFDIPFGFRESFLNEIYFRDHVIKKIGCGFLEVLEILS